jgi:hypothetical protein
MPHKLSPTETPADVVYWYSQPMRAVCRNRSDVHAFERNAIKKALEQPAPMRNKIAAVASILYAGDLVIAELEAKS